MASRGSVVRRRAAAHRAAQRRNANERELQSAYISTYWQFKGYADSGSGPASSGYYWNPGPRGGYKNEANRNLPRNQSYATFTWYTPESIARNKGGSITQPKEYFSRFTHAQAYSRRNDVATWRGISESYKTKAIKSELGSLQNIPLLKPFDSSSVGSQRGRSRGGSTKTVMVSDGPGRPLKAKIINTAPTAKQRVMLANAAMSDSKKVAMGANDWNSGNSSSSTIFYDQGVIKPTNVYDANLAKLPESTTVGSATYKNPIYNSKYKDSYQYQEWGDGVNIKSYSKKSENFQELLKVREEFSASKDPADQIHLAIQEKIYKDGQRNAYLQNFAFGGGTLSMESRAGIGKKEKSLRASKSGNYTGARDIEYNKQVAQFRADQLDTGLTDEEVHANISKSKTDTRAEMSKLGGFMMQYEYLKKNKNSSQAHKDKVSALHAKVQSAFPGLDVSGNSAQMIGRLEKRIDISKSSLTKINAQQDAMGLYMAKNRIIDRDIARGEVSGLKNRDADKARKAKVRAAEQAAAQKAFDELWREGAGQALMSDSSVNNLNPERITPLPSKSSELTRTVGIIKKYDAWDQRRNYISGQLDTRRSNLNTYYNSNWQQDFTVSDTEASQYMFGSDTPSGTSLTRNAVTAIGINQKKPRKAIENINKILAQTGENRSVYAENLAGIETKLLTLKEKQALKKAENDAIKARIAQQVTDDFNAGNVEINTTFRDSITGTSEELYDLNTQVAEHNTIKTYYDKSLAQTDEDTATLKNTLEEIIKVKQQNDYDTITSGADGDGGNRSQSSLSGYNKARRFKQSTGGRKQMVRSGGGKIQRTRSGKSLSGLVI